MSIIHGKWNVDDIRAVIYSLDMKTGMNGAALPIYLCKSLGEGKTLGTYRPGCGKDKDFRSFSFSLAYFNDAGFKDLAVIDVIRHEYCHYLVDELELKDIYSDQDAHGIAWKTVCGLLNTDQNGAYVPWHFSATTNAGLEKATLSMDIPQVDILRQIERWGNELPSVAKRRSMERELIKKYSKLRVFAVNDDVVHEKFGRGKVLDTMPATNKQFLYVQFENGDSRIVQNRQVYKLVNGQVKKPMSKAR